MPRLRLPSVTTLATPIVVLGVVVAVVAPTLRDGVQAHRAVRVPHPTSTPVVRQDHATGCGAALLATLLRRAGRPVSQERLLAAEPPGPTGISLAAFRRLAGAYGLPGHWRRRLGAVLPEPGFVAHLDRPAGHFVYVDGRVGPYLHVFDPAEGASVWHVDLFRARWSGRYLRLGGLA